jgi:hypothetical protein
MSFLKKSFAFLFGAKVMVPPLLIGTNASSMMFKRRKAERGNAVCHRMSAVDPVIVQPRIPAIVFGFSTAASMFPGFCPAGRGAA